MHVGVECCNRSIAHMRTAAISTLPFARQRILEKENLLAALICHTQFSLCFPFTFFIYFFLGEWPDSILHSTGRRLSSWAVSQTKTAAGIQYFQNDFSIEFRWRDSLPQQYAMQCNGIGQVEMSFFFSSHHQLHSECFCKCRATCSRYLQ